MCSELGGLSLERKNRSARLALRLPFPVRLSTFIKRPRALEIMHNYFYDSGDSLITHIFIFTRVPSLLFYLLLFFLHPFFAPAWEARLVCVAVRAVCRGGVARTMCYIYIYIYTHTVRYYIMLYVYMCVCMYIHTWHDIERNLRPVRARSVVSRRALVAVTVKVKFVNETSFAESGLTGYPNPATFRLRPAFNHSRLKKKVR